MRYFSFWAFPTLGLLLWVAARSLEPNYPLVAMLLWMPLGMMFWTLLEYTLHRFVFHWRPSNRNLRRMIARLHLVHHGDTHDPDKIFVSPPYSLTISSVILLTLTWILGSLSPAVATLVGIWGGFLYYETVHYRVHLSKHSSGLLQHQRRAHFIHHFIDDKSCYGVTSPFWDILLGTYRTLD